MTKTQQTESRVASDPKGAQLYQKQQKTESLKRAAALSQHSQSATEIQHQLNISERTLKRYVKDPLWQRFGGKSIFFRKRGRPFCQGLSETEKALLTQAYSLYPQKKTWQKVAELLEMPLDRLENLRRKGSKFSFPEKTASELREVLEREQLSAAFSLRETHQMKWGDISQKLGINQNRLNYLRRKYAKNDTPVTR